MKQLEQTIQRNCINWYKRMFPDNYIRKNEQVVKSGDPDILICHYGLFVAIEMKQVGKNPTPLQKLKLARISASGGVVGVAHSLDEFKDIICKAERQTRHFETEEGIAWETSLLLGGTSND